MNPLWTLAAWGLLAGAASAWCFRRIADTGAIATAWRHMQARLLEFWLYADEPRLIGKSWKGLLQANGRFLRHMFLPAALLSIPMVPLFFLLDTCYGHAPLVPGKPAIVTVRLNQLSPVQLTVPDGLAVEGLPVRIFDAHEVSWRVRPRHALSGNLLCTTGEARLTKNVSSGAGLRWLSQRRTRTFLDLIRYPTEAPLPAGPVEWIEVAYPPASLSFAGLDLHWSVWFLAFLLLGAILPLPPGFN